MYRAIPVVNKSVYRHTQERNDKIHAIKVLCANTQIDFSEPYRYKHLESKMKRERILEGIRIILIDALKSRRATECCSKISNTYLNETANNRNPYRIKEH